MLGIAQEFEMVAVAEGIETEAQRQFLRDVGCPIGQGFLHERPVPLAALLDATPTDDRHPTPDH
jgi:EAL domain-containing protein (putative c-di-GMP-specific phosphodiesterase class I)